MEAEENKSGNENPVSWDNLIEVPFAGDLYRQKKFGQIAITNNLRKLAKPGINTGKVEAGQMGSNQASPMTTLADDSATINLHEPDDETLCRQFLTIIHDNADIMELFIHSDEIEFYESLAKTFRDRIDTVQFPYFAVDLFLLIRAWSEESFNEDLIDDYYLRRLMGILQCYGYLS